MVKLYLGSNRILGGACSITVGSVPLVRLGTADEQVQIAIEVYSRDGRHLASCANGEWSGLEPGLQAIADGSSVTLVRDGQVLVRLLTRPRFTKLVQADFYGPQGDHLVIGIDGALRLSSPQDVCQLEVADCEFIGEAHFAEVPVGSIGHDTTLLHGSGVSYTREAIGQRILSSEFTPSDATSAMAAAGMSLN